MDKPSLSSFVKSPLQKEDFEDEREKNAQSMWEALRGPKGKPGITPKRGVDYWTTEDKKEIINETVKILPSFKDGKTPKKGKDYFTEDDKREFVSIVRDSVVELMPEVTERESVQLTVQDIEGIEEFVQSYIPSQEVDEFTQLFISEIKKQSGADRIKDSAGMSLLIQKLGQNFYKGYVAGPGFGGGASSTGTSGTQVFNEVVSGSAKAWALAHTPQTGTLRLFANGQRLTPTVDYTLTGANIVTVTSWALGTLIADYTY